MKRTLSGMKWGLIMATLLSLWVLLLIPFNGGPVFRSKTGVEIHAAWIILVYILGGLLTGALFGGLSRFLHHRPIAFLLGMVAMMPIGTAVLLTENRFQTWTRLETIAVAIMAIAFGGPGGTIVAAFIDSEGN
jgi:hypothetical protein